MADFNSWDTQDFLWSQKLQRYIASGQKGQALRLLDRVIDYGMPLFENDPELQKNRRLAWLYRIDLLYNL